jgi:hypothetical protein
MPSTESPKRFRGNSKTLLMCVRLLPDRRALLPKAANAPWLSRGSFTRMPAVSAKAIFYQAKAKRVAPIQYSTAWYLKHRSDCSMGLVYQST